MTEAAAALGFSHSNTEYHTRFLVRHHILVSKRVARFQRYWLNGAHNDPKAVAAPMLRHPTGQGIIRLLQDPTQKHQVMELSRRLQVSPPTVTWHLRSLMECGVVERVGREYNIRPGVLG